MPPKTRKFLDVINEKLYRNAPSDFFLIFEERDFTKVGFAVGEIEEMMEYLKREKVAANYRSYSVAQDVSRLPITPEEKALRLQWSWRELLAGEKVKDRYALELVSRDAFLNFYSSSPVGKNAKISESHLAEKTITNRLKSEGLFVVSRSNGEDLHLLIGKPEDKGEKAHVIIDGKTGEVRVEDNQKEPTELVARVEGILTLPSGKRIKTSREAIEELAEEKKTPLDAVGKVLELWNLFHVAYGALMDLTSPLQTYADLNRMSESQFEEWLASSNLPNFRKEELRRADDRTKHYSEIRVWGQLDKAYSTRAEFNNALLALQPLLAVDIKAAFKSINEMMYTALSQMNIAVEAGDFKMRAAAAQLALGIQNEVSKLEELIHQKYGS